MPKMHGSLRIGDYQLAGRSFWSLLELVPIIRFDVKSASNLANMLDFMRIHVKSTSISTNMLYFGRICEN
ncbi:hypothetical protein ASG93_25360 [Paenibacillus sp. Soil787]|nr:hypothetical protein ASG93_25360 [Paenibacillus sp. Soil787]